MIDYSEHKHYFLRTGPDTCQCDFDKTTPIWLNRFHYNFTQTTTTTPILMESRVVALNCVMNCISIAVQHFIPKSTVLFHRNNWNHNNCAVLVALKWWLFSILPRNHVIEVAHGANVVILHDNLSMTTMHVFSKIGQTSECSLFRGVNTVLMEYWRIKHDVQFESCEG